MSKIGKRYLLSSDGAKLTKNFSNLLTGAVKLETITEQYNNQSNLYTGTIVINGPRNLLENVFNAAQTLTSSNLDVIFNLDTHYEDLLELKAEMAKPSSSLNDSLNLYKYSNPLEYNFLVRNYEEYLKANQQVQETALPYFYEVLEEFVSTENVEGFGTSFFETPAVFITASFRNELKTNIIPYEVLINDKPLRIDKYLQKYNIFKEQFPFYADISFDSHELKEKSLIEAINDKGLFTTLVQTAVGQNAIKKLAFNGLTTKQSGNIFVKEMNVDAFLNAQLDSFVDNDFTYIFDINQRIDSKARDFIEVLKGEPEYSEVIGYHLKKFEGNTNSLLQEWILPNVSDVAMSWVDSQIKYDKLYTYKLDPIVLSFGTQYNFTDVRFDNTGRLVIQFVNKPLVKAYIFSNIENTSNSTLGAEYTNRLLDYPPLEPEIELIPFIGVDNQIKINLNTSTGLKTVPAINFAPTEEAAKDKLRLAQNKDVNSPLLTFQTDEPADRIEIYKIEDVKPSSYEDFFNKSLTVLSTNNSSGASYLHNITKNKKYYYIARCIDYHGNISNPTPVYELEIVNDNGLIIPYINIVEFDKKENVKQASKEFKRFLKIQPAIRHRLVNYERTDQTNIELGNDEKTPWNKRFKLRFISKSTGKKIDVNFKFKYKKPE